MRFPHRSLPNVTHVFEDAHKADKLAVLRDVLARHRNKQLRTLIFCNTVASCRAVEYAINQDTVVGGSFSGSQAGGDSEHAIKATSYHGDLNSNEREHNLAKFRNGELFATSLHTKTLPNSLDLLFSKLLTLTRMSQHLQHT